MTARNFTSLPVVDISALGGRDPEARARTAAALRVAARDVGFLYVTGHGMAPALFDGLLAAATEFFARPHDEKMQVYIGRSSNHRGYVPVGEEVFYGASKDLKEAYDLALDLPAADPDYLAGNPMLGPNQWPALPGFRERVGAYYDAVLAVGRRLLQGFAEAMGEAPDGLDHLVTKPPSQLRLVHYPFNPEAKDATGIGAHTDYECFTLLHVTAPGLEVMNGAGVWIDVPPMPGAFVVNIGDMMELWTNGAFVATSHRVRKVKEERYSFPLFFNVDYGTEVEPLPRFVDADHPARPGLIAGEHLFAQTAQSFTYLRQRLEGGTLKLPETALALSSFGQEARKKAG
ncbi:isopenicillin N synthase family dioxygenase [Zavarzinia compransoris]|uniref:2OG-Fe(II) oxygenase n=1 Tax=Zavarzinia compransoris TaxID=1264899 RepID=A0A317EFG5_9PROT|nr:2-oxoglutarate and iron-dependent oxygenase domain-containing protein [Zavarzinia compransoris]PWR23925.1 2OG-Fe(II) oxygenase [Zavarzinia compransoris]TDP48170.1 isopenicillin N synthase-like dioxygenase [Zavarzinia compransoris]